ncbi:MAG: N-acyl-L-amino acid amidohydrolase [Bacteroidetes bacterium]|jgi:amidohydrolase|nr:N-acyl-L-amino acid amidohydrolase [Bacteroidota bacterium]
MADKNQIHSLSQKYFTKVVGIRQHLHKHPELSFNEFKTSEYIQKQLSEAGIAFTTGHVKTGIIALIKGKNPEKKTLLLRADMDALPILEKNDVAYKSCNEGVMHACGHDVHSATMLGAAFILNDLRDQIEGTVKIMFQPGEEVLPGGASLMIGEGVLENPKVDKAIALHVFPSMETGKVGFKSGMYMASTDELYLTVTGKGGHAAMPADYINPLIVASEILLEINKRFMIPGALTGTNGESVPTVVAFGKIEGKGATNVIPDKVEIEGTFRTMNEAWRDEVHATLKEIAKTVALKNNATAELRIERGYPFLVNDEKFTVASIASAQEYLGKENVEELPLRMTAEDFAYITQKVPSCFFRLGTGNKSKGITSGVHTATFDIDERALETGMGLVVYLSLKELS